VNFQTRQWLHGLVFALGVMLIVFGIVTRTPGAGIVGLIIAAVNFQQWKKKGN
jgi:hypothetical protein